jgi:two-component system sensor histidine kinase ChvG
MGARAEVGQSQISAAALVQRPIERRSSLLLRLVVVMLLVAIAPELIVVVWSLYAKEPWTFVSLRHHLLRLALLTTPVALTLAFYMGRRLVRPIEHLRRQALEKAAAQSPRTVLDAERRDEVGVLADAFNVLLLALEKKRVDHQAFVADLVHEFKNPVAAVRACADTLVSGPLDEERAARIARVLHDSTGKLDQLVTHVLELARAEAGMPNEERSRVDVRALTSALVERFRDDARYAGRRFLFEAPEEPSIVLGVPHRLDALFRELVDNGASFAGEDGIVRVSVASSGGEVRIVVSDDGPGISADDLSKVFERFFTRRQGERRGTGLGLALVRAVTEAHGGTVIASSRPGEGASFEVRLPRT